jgi:hypothetical protein
VVSEERGEVTLMWERKAQGMKDARELQATLQTLSTDGNATSAPHRGFRPAELGLVTAAVALAALAYILVSRSIGSRTDGSGGVHECASRDDDRRSINGNG